MDTAQALQTLVSAAQVAQGKGAFSLQEAAVVSEAVNIFTAGQTQPEEQPSETNTPNESVKEPVE